jgi:acetyl-CoA C-acetyltransferase
VRPHKDILVLAARRLPQGRFGGSLAGLGAVNLGTTLVSSMLAEPSLPRPDRVIWGMARSHTQGMNPARTIALKAGLPVSSTAYTVNMACGSSLASVILAAQSLGCGESRPILAGGSEAMSDTPFLLPGLRWGYGLGHRRAPDVMHQDGLRCPMTGLLMGETIERLAEARGITREEADAYAIESHHRAARADFLRELLPHPRLDRDECIRPGVTQEDLAGLKPVFASGGQITAGNASALSDGAAALLLAAPEQAQGLRPLGRILGWAEAGLDPLETGEGPLPAVQKLLEESGLGIQDIDLWELNEAFAAQVIFCARQLNLPLERLNTAGGGISLGHPIGASGARILVTLFHQLHRRGGGLGIATMGIGGGLGQAVLVECR